MIVMIEFAKQSTSKSKRKLAHNFLSFHLVFLSCQLNVVKTLITEDNKNTYIIHMYSTGRKI